MRIAVFGATGRTGRLIVQDALVQGHEVVAFVRSTDKLFEQQNRDDPALSHVQGDVRDAAAVALAVEGADVVVSALAPVSGQPMTQADGTANILRAMQTAGVERIVSLTGSGVDAPGDVERPLSARAFLVVFRVVGGWILRDGQAHADALRTSDRDWVAVRPPRLTDGPATGRARHGILALPASASISRADVADFMLREAVAPSYHRAAPHVTGP